MSVYDVEDLLSLLFASVSSFSCLVYALPRSGLEVTTPGSKKTASEEHSKKERGNPCSALL